MAVLSFLFIAQCILLTQSTDYPLPSNPYIANEYAKRYMEKKSPAASTPNFVIFFVDDMGYGDVGFTGNPSINTPNIDALAREGMILSTWYTGQPVCSPSRAAMLTGRYPVRSGCAGGWSGGVFSAGSKGGLPDNETTFGTVLQQNGYSTKMIGKWHVGQRDQFQPHSHGFNESFWIPYSVDMGSSAWLPSSAALPLPLLNGSIVLQQPVDLSKVSDLYIGEASNFISKNAAAGTPFLLYMAHSHVHVPDFTNTEYCNSSIHGRFGDAVQEVDSVIGAIYAEIKSAGIDDNTLIFFTADNGPWLEKELAGGSSGLFNQGKFTTWEGGMRQPAFAHWPGRIAPGTRSTELVSTMDIFMTIINISNSMQYLPNDGRLYDGKDMSNIIFNENGGKSQHDCYYMYGGAIDAGNCPYEEWDLEYEVCSGLWAVRCHIPGYNTSFKAHWVTRFTNGTISIQSPPLLYNIDWDPSEMHPISSHNSQYDYILTYLFNKRNENLATIKPVTNQMLLGGNSEFEICGAPNSKSIYPQYPNCTLTTGGYTGFTCNPVCYDEDSCDGGEPVGPDYNIPGYTIPFKNANGVFEANTDDFTDQDVYVTINYN